MVPGGAGGPRGWDSEGGVGSQEARQQVSCSPCLAGRKDRSSFMGTGKEGDPGDRRRLCVRETTGKRQFHGSNCEMAPLI